MNRHLLNLPIRIASVIALSLACAQPARAAVFADHAGKTGRANPLGEPSSAVLAGLGLAVLACFSAARPAPRPLPGLRARPGAPQSHPRLLAGSGAVHLIGP